MNPGKLLAFAGAAFFVLYGLAFAIIPAAMSGLVTDSTPSSSSGMIDMRATYGGMTIGIGLLIAFLAKEDSTLHHSIQLLMWLMIGMATTRIYGILVDGDPNTLMYVYLGLEVVVASVCSVWQFRHKQGSA